MIRTVFISLALRLREKISARAPDMTIGGDENPYLHRWFVVPRNSVFNIYLHKFMRSDDDRALHDHPWINLSFIFDGWYIEHRIADGGVNYRIRRSAGSCALRAANSAHRIEVEKPCWTIFMTGPRMRSWGFHCPGGWVHWRDFTNPLDGGRTVGRGCGALDEAQRG